MAPSRWLLSLAFFYAFACLVLIADARASACKSGSSGENSSSCDTRNRDKVIKCSTGATGTYPPCPAKDMPMKSTPLKAFHDLSPYLWVTAPDPDDPSKPYSGPFARGTALDPTQTFMIVGNPGNTADGKPVKGQNACADQINIQLSPIDVNNEQSLREWAALSRLKLGQCAMQYILNASANVAYRANSATLSGENPNDPSARTSLQTHGLPLKTKFSGDSEYNANNYLKAASVKSLENPAARIDSDSSLSSLFSSFNFSTMYAKLMSSAMSTLSSVTDQTMAQVTAQTQQLQSQYQNATQMKVDAQFNMLLNNKNLNNQLAGAQQTVSSVANSANTITNTAQQASSTLGGVAQQAQQASSTVQQASSALGGAVQQASSALGGVTQQAQQASSAVQQASSALGGAAQQAAGSIAALGSVGASVNLSGSLNMNMPQIDVNAYLNSAKAKAMATINSLMSKFGSKEKTAEPGFPPNLPLTANKAPPKNFQSPLAAIAGNQNGSKSNYQFMADPTHVWTPRWDFSFTEREEYSKKTSTYSEDTKNSVYCAGNRANGSSGGGGGSSSDDKKYLVDVLSFRKDKFEDGMVNKRIAFNELCYKDTTNFKSMPTALVAAASYCWKCADLPYCYTADSIKCWECFDLTQNQKVKENEDPPCATRYDGDDLKIKSTDQGMSVFPGFLNSYNPTAYCTAIPFDTQTSASTLCKDLRAPYVNANMMTMRYHPGKGKEGDELPGGVPEGYTFKEYFKDHMPYPALWDTGQSIQETASNDQDPLDTMGQYTAIVGVGREADASGGGGGGGGNAPKDQRCLYGGWGKDTTIGGFTFKKGDPMTSTVELILYQARGLREHHLNGMLSYEKGAGQRGSEAQLLKRAGGTVKLVMACKTASGGGAPQCRFVGDGGASPKIEPDEVVRFKEISVPLQWRGYVSDPVPEQQFPKLGGGGSKGLYTGLDNAQCGDFVILPHGGGTESSPGLPGLGRVIGINLPGRSSCDFAGTAKKKAGSSADCGADCYIEIEEANSGKWPDVCGSTTVAGSIQKRRMYKTANSNRPFDKEMARIKWTTSCEDPGMNECVFSHGWANTQLYRVSEDRRDGAT